jgi:exopolyphosphatase/guanosine-5'-triphosphate,3'-diphosphate pyrophosphatase
VTRLGQGQATAGALAPAAVARTVDTVVDFVRRAQRLGAEPVRIVATSAVREAPNRDAFTAELARVTGRAVEVISGDEEARLTLLGVRSGLPGLAGRHLVLDIGGGSTELTLAGDRGLERSVSLRLGVVAYGEGHPGDGRYEAGRLDALHAAVRERLAREIPDAIAAAGARQLVGTAGTVTTLAALDLGLSVYDPARVQGHRLARAAVERVLALLAAMTNAARAELPALEAGRADLIVPGIVICLEVMGRVALDALTVSDRGLREGIVCEILAASPP